MSVSGTKGTKGQCFYGACLNVGQLRKRDEKYMKPPWQILEPGPKNEFPDKIYVIVEVSKESKEKYELDKKTGALFLDRDLSGSMVYPGDYGSVPKTLAEDKDPVDALIMTARPHYPGTVILARPIALLKMTDEKGEDNKILCVANISADPDLEKTKDLKDIPKNLLQEIENFFKHYKELEAGKWVKIEKWQDASEAKKYILEAAKRYKCGSCGTPKMRKVQK